MSEEQRAATHEMAIALLEDIEHLREVAEKSVPDSGELRRASVAMRKALVNRDAVKVASPRIGRLMLQQPDNKPAYVEQRSESFLVYFSGPTEAYGCKFASLKFLKKGILEYFSGHPKLMDVTVDQFNKQRVLCFKDIWASRKSLIKYLANKAHGAHSDSRLSPEEEAIRQYGFSGYVKLDEERPVMTFENPLFSNEEFPFPYRSDSVNLVSLEFLAAIQLFVNSPDVIRLESVIRQEILDRNG